MALGAGARVRVALPLLAAGPGAATGETGGRRGESGTGVADGTGPIHVVRSELGVYWDPYTEERGLVRGVDVLTPIRPVCGSNSHNGVFCTAPRGGRGG